MTDQEPKETPDLSRMFSDVKEFNDRYGLAYFGPPRALQNGIGRMRATMIREETKEYLGNHEEALAESCLGPEDFQPDEYRRLLTECLDGLVDIVYATMVTADQHGFDFDTAWARVHAANMSKRRSESRNPTDRGGQYDIVKPEGWQSPDLSDLVKVTDLC